MTIKTALLAGAAAALLTAVPAMAQDAPPAATPAEAAPAQAAPAAPQSLTLTPGATVRGGDGELGKLEGVQSNATGQQELTVRGADGQVRAVPLAGIRQEGSDVVVAYTKAEFDAAAAIPGAAPPPPAATPSAPPSTMPAAPSALPPAPTESEPADPAAIEPADPSTAPDPMTPPADEAAEPQVN